MRDAKLEPIIHVYLLNRVILIMPFHSMPLVCPATEGSVVTRFLKVFAESVEARS